MTTSAQAINDLRHRVLQGEEPPREELEAALRLVREERAAGATASAEKKKKKEGLSADFDLNTLFDKKEEDK